MAYNNFLYKDNLYKNGEYRPNHSAAMKKEKARNITPTKKQVEYRDALYNFCLKKGILKGGFPLSRTESGMRSNIRAFISIIKKNGLMDVYLEERKDNEKDS